MSTASVEADAARMGFVKTRLGPDFHTVRWLLQCSKCPRQFTASWSGGMKPEAMARQVRKRSWDVDYGMRPLCPSCAHKKDKGPLPKPDNQTFERFVPPQTAISVALFDAALKRANLARIEELTKSIDKRTEKIEALKMAEKATRAILEEDRRLGVAQSRVAQARAAREKRLQETREARERGAHAFRQAQLKERCGTISTEVIKVTEVIAPAEQAIAQQAEEEVMNKTMPTPNPKITHSVFQMLDDIFDAEKRLYRSGYTDQRVAKECGTSEEVVTYLRIETFGQLAEDPRISAIRDDLELLAMESAEQFAKLQKTLGELRSRVEQVARS